MTPVWFGKCCRIWPLVIGVKTGRCGLCGSDKFTPATDEEIKQYLKERGQTC